jgi:type I restriction enzyme R subunit
MSQTNEHAFETYVEEMLLSNGGWSPGSNAEWDKERALFPAQIFAFIADTQPKIWGEMPLLSKTGKF